MKRILNIVKRAIIQAIKSGLKIGIWFSLGCLLIAWLANSSMDMESSIKTYLELFFGPIEMAISIAFLFNIGKEIAREDQLDERDVLKSEIYYRDILKTNSPLIIGYIDDYQITKNKIVAELLYLEKKGAIKIENDIVEIKNDYKGEELLECEKFLLNTIHNGKIDLDDSKLKLLRNYIINEAIVKFNLLDSENVIKRKLKKAKILFLILIINFVFMYIIGEYCYKMFGDFEDIIFPIYMLWGVITIPATTWVFIYICGYNSYYAKKIKNMEFPRSKKGKELNKRVEGLKNYLRDYSLIKEENSTDITLWEEYLIYSVLFGINIKILKEYGEIVRIKFKQNI